MLYNKPIIIDPSPLFDYVYLVRYKRLEATSVEYLKEMGTYTTGIPEMDKALNNEVMSTYINISDMLELFKKGVKVSVVNYEDIKKIYEAISNHLESWKARLETGVNVNNAPYEDLIALDEFANVIYPHAVHMFNKDTIDNLFVRKLSSLTTTGPQNFFKKGSKANKILEGNTSEDIIINGSKTENIPQRQGISTLLKERLVSKNKWN